MQNIRQFVANRLRSLIGDQSQHAFAKRTGVAQSSINRILSLSQSPTAEILSDISAALHLHPSYFVLEDNESELLSQFAKLSKDDKLKVLGYISYTISTYSTKKELDDEFTIDLKPGLQAAVLRANSKNLADDKTKLSRNTQNSLRRARSK